MELRHHRLCDDDDDDDDDGVPSGPRRHRLLSERGFDNNGCNFIDYFHSRELLHTNLQPSRPAGPAAVHLFYNPVFLHGDLLACIR